MPNTAKFYGRIDVARLIGDTDHRVRFVIRSRGIKPAFLIGGRPAYSEAAVEQIRQALESTKAYWKNHIGVKA